MTPETELVIVPNYDTVNAHCFTAQNGLTLITVHLASNATMQIFGTHNQLHDLLDVLRSAVQHDENDADLQRMRLEEAAELGRDDEPPRITGDEPLGGPDNDYDNAF